VEKDGCGQPAVKISSRNNAAPTLLENVEPNQPSGAKARLDALGFVWSTRKVANSELETGTAVETGGKARDGKRPGVRLA
jgi:hypothetical protein